MPTKSAGFRKNQFAATLTPPALKCSSHYQTADSLKNSAFYRGIETGSQKGAVLERKAVMAKRLVGVKQEKTVFLFFFKIPQKWQISYGCDSKAFPGQGTALDTLYSVSGASNPNNCKSTCNACPRRKCRVGSALSICRASSRACSSNS